MLPALRETDLYGRVKNALQKVIYSTASLEHVTPETRLLEDLDMDSVRVVDLVLGLEDEFGIRIEDDEIERLRTFGDLISMLRTKLA